MLALELDIKTMQSKNGVLFTIQITEQRLRGVAAKLTTSNGFTFKSVSTPAIGIGFNNGLDSHPVNVNGLLFLRGSSSRHDAKILHTRSIGYVNKLKAAVKEYNIIKATIL